MFLVSLRFTALTVLVVLDLIISPDNNQGQVKGFSIKYYQKVLTDIGHHFDINKNDNILK